VTGGTDDYRGAKLTVYRGTGVSCATTMQVITDLSTGKAQNHSGADSESSYFVVDGWKCPYGNMDVQNCGKGNLQIAAYAPGARP